MLSTPSRMLPYDFVVLGRPTHFSNTLAHQSWQQAVHEAAAAAWCADALLVQPVSIVITYYYNLDNQGNLPKSASILRSVQGVLRSLSDVEPTQSINFVMQRRNLNSSFRVRDLSPQLAAGFCSGGEFIHVMIKDLSRLTSTVVGEYESSNSQSFTRTSTIAKAC